MKGKRTRSRSQKSISLLRGISLNNKKTPQSWQLIRGV
nr:MAG TPA: hypothetical protein [Caudoviricetes sp.]